MPIYAFTPLAIGFLKITGLRSLELQIGKICQKWRCKFYGSKCVIGPTSYVLRLEFPFNKIFRGSKISPNWVPKQEFAKWDYTKTRFRQNEEKVKKHCKPLAPALLLVLQLDHFSVLWSQNFLFPLRLRLTKSFGSGISFVTTFYHRFHIKKWIYHVFYDRIST